MAGATGWAPSEFCKVIVSIQDLEIVSAVSRKNAGKNLVEVLKLETQKNIPVFGTVEEALSIPCEVLLDYTSPEVVKNNVIKAINKGVNVVIGTSGLSDEDYKELSVLADEKGRSVLAIGNFAMSVVLLNKFSEIAAKYMNHWEVIDYADDKKVDAPSGSALELVERLAKAGKPEIKIPINEVHGIKETRGANINHTQVHSVRLPGYIISLETIFGMESEKLILRHEAGESAKPYVAGALLVYVR